MEPEKKSNGAIVGLVIIVIILVIGAIYIWSTKADKAPLEFENITEEDSAELNTLEAELETADTNTGVDAGAIN